MFFTVVDDIDRDILAHLQHDGRLTQRELGQLVGLSPNAAGARVARLLERGIISGIHARIDHSKLGRGIEASIDVWRHDRTDESALREVLTDERITECFHLTGPVDFRIRAMVSSTDDLNDLLNRLKNEADIRQTDSRLVLEQLDTRPARPE